MKKLLYILVCMILVLSGCNKNDLAEIHSNNNSELAANEADKAINEDEDENYITQNNISNNIEDTESIEIKTKEEITSELEDLSIDKIINYIKDSIKVYSYNVYDSSDPQVAELFKNIFNIEKLQASYTNVAKFMLLIPDTYERLNLKDYATAEITRFDLDISDENIYICDEWLDSYTSSFYYMNNLYKIKTYFLAFNNQDLKIEDLPFEVEYEIDGKVRNNNKRSLDECWSSDLTYINEKIQLDESLIPVLLKEDRDYEDIFSSIIEDSDENSTHDRTRHIITEINEQPIIIGIYNDPFRSDGHYGGTGTVERSEVFECKLSSISPNIALTNLIKSVSISTKDNIDIDGFFELLGDRDDYSKSYLYKSKKLDQLDLNNYENESKFNTTTTFLIKFTKIGQDSIENIHPYEIIQLSNYIILTITDFNDKTYNIDFDFHW